jgi:hypothetical protein
VASEEKGPSAVWTESDRVALSNQRTDELAVGVPREFLDDGVEDVLHDGALDVIAAKEDMEGGSEEEGVR